MQWMKYLCITALLLALVSASSDSSDDSSDSQSRNPDVKRIRIDSTLRKALLRALRHLKDRQEEESDQLNDSNTTEENFSTTLLDEILEESTYSDRETNIRYHSYEAADSTSDNGSNEIIKTIIISKPKTTLIPPKVDLLRSESVPDPIKERENDVDSNQVARSVSSGSGTNNLDETKDEKSSITVVTPIPSVVTSQVTPTETVSTTTTTTTKAPTHNADGENIEKVKSEDVKIYQAPLVAAFTVQQDQLGVPHNVIPLLQVPTKKAPVDFTGATPSFPKIIPISQASSTTNQNQNPPTVQTPVPLNTRALEEKTRLLEQQLITLQNQQRIQEQLLRNKIIQEQQLILQQQQQLQQQRFRLEEETRIRLQKFEEEQRLFRQQQQQLQQQQFKLQQQQQQQQPLFKQFPVQQQPNNQQSQPLQQQQPQAQFIQELPRTGPAVQFIPSVSLPGKSIPISVEQQLPFKEAVDFQPRNTFVEQVKSISPPVQQFPIIPPSPPQLSKQQLLPLKPFQTFNVNPFPTPLNSQLQLPQDQQLPHLQRNRVFRHESGTGNFGFNSQPQQQSSNAPFRPSQQLPIFQQNSGFQPLRSDNQLQNLLVQSGITSRSAEDFNIITKVLALNHGIPQSSSQLMFAKLSPEQQQQLLFRK
ncbi:putative mediator of RNA polymerase II transcription subunit 12 [Malaya genurostris]|uniref:putative mediator of RNA polymerase II transcription subunit 12 n=1 Tax=Malaya genurostris TaxID=325434 RepID=UPI0026F403B9|nr:putative mediator of RNA polymerase II transcription subunit 12 [Malaya genurostris]